jgi:solute carrier family 35 (UDP-sugar transporter), member A1/2/3
MTTTSTALKYASLLVLVVQNSALSILLRAAVVFGDGAAGPRQTIINHTSSASNGVAVLAAESLKCLVALAVLTWIRAPFAASSTKSPTSTSVARLVFADCFGPVSQWQLVIIPAALYYLQNNLQYQAAALLDAATFQVTYQLKLLTTAIFSVVLLRKTLSRIKWACLLLLTMGVAMVQLPVKPPDATNSPSMGGGSWRRFQGLLTVLLACTLSGLAGVWLVLVLPMLLHY